MPKTLDAEDIDRLMSLQLANTEVMWCTRTNDPAQKVEHLTRAISYFKPLAGTEPAAAFGIGLLAEHMGDYSLLYNKGLTITEVLPAAFDFYDKAATYYRNAGSLMTDDPQCHRGRALNSLAFLHETGVLSERNLSTQNQVAYFSQMANKPAAVECTHAAYKEYALMALKNSAIIKPSDPRQTLAFYQEAAELDFAEAQINFAIMLYRGEVDAPNRAEAYHWLKKAESNQWQLTQDTQQELTVMLRQLAAELNQQPDRAPVRPAAPTLTGISSSTPHRRG